MARERRTEKFLVSADRRGITKFEQAYDAYDAARRATKLARQGYKVRVLGSSSTPKMTCEPVERRGKVAAKCSIGKMFKKQIKGK